MLDDYRDDVPGSVGEAHLDSSRSLFACPTCRTGTGVPHRVTTKGFFAVVLRVRCQPCGHAWDISRPMLRGVASFEGDLDVADAVKVQASARTS